MRYLWKTLFILCSIELGLQNLVWGQEVVGERVETTIEEQLRQNLNKLERWGIKQLLYTERQVDQSQKERARISTNSEELALLAGDEDSGVRFYVAANRHTSIEILEILTDDPVDYVRTGVAHGLNYDPSAPDSIRSRVKKIATSLSSDPQVLVRLVLAANRAIAPDVFVQLSLDSDFLVREKLSSNPNINQEALINLAQDTVMTVQLTALIHKNLPPSILNEKSIDPLWQVRQAISLNPNVPSTVLNQLSKDEQVEVRRQVAEHHRTLGKTLKAMLNDKDTQVLQAIAQHPKADRDILAVLSLHQDKAVRTKAEKRLEPILRREIREDVLERWNLN
jgi:hypothetical protein